MSVYWEQNANLIQLVCDASDNDVFHNSSIEAVISCFRFYRILASLFIVSHKAVIIPNI